ncbi:innexin inx1-like [Panulirus ornatus]|uniref:innexin inx1-like n=1 Tax=Panulirus ornatus TaxID=150431 RepID=UPI003A8B0AF5
MFEVFDGLKKHIHTSGATKPKVSSLLFSSAKLCMLITLLACVLVTAKNYIGDNIKCITGFEKQEHKAIETYCFIASTFTLVDLNAETPHPGVGPNTKMTEEGVIEEAENRRHAYYQWVPMVLVLQAVIYYFPIWIWHRIDKGFFEATICHLDKVHIGDISKNIESSSQYFASSLTTHRSYGLGFLLCECLTCAISMGNLFFTNTFLGGEFFQFGPAALKYLGSDATDPNNPLNEIFPKVAKCTWHKFGASGTIQKFDSMCVLPLNIVNEKTYIFLWVVYIITAAICGFVLLLHILLFLLPSVRNTFLVYLAHKQMTKVELQHVLPKCNYGDWFLMYHFKSNMAYFAKWVSAVRVELSK